MNRLSRQIPKGGTRGKKFREVGLQRLDDADILIRGNRYQAAIYMAGYAIECQLKFAYCDRQNQTYLPSNLEIHDWDLLAKQSGVLAEIKAQPSVDALYCELVEVWHPELRYRTNLDNSKAHKLFAHFQQLYQFLKEL